VFAEHVEIVERIAAKFGNACVKIRGGVSQANRMEAVRRFQNDDEVRVFVGNMAAASEGLTLTKASNVVFCELAWTPTMHAQCASRCYARANDMHGATAWYLLANKTIDLDIYALLQKKELIVNAATEGADLEKQTSVLGDLIVALAKRGLDRG
jgi:SWI/SNF-related matrix-associated actin-dependent regulator 1 of chromatin subfamily A